MGTSSAAGAQRTAPGAPGLGLPPSGRHRSRPHRGDEPVQRITTAPVGQRQHQQQQIGRYLLSMGIRTSCFVVAILLATSGRLMWLMWVFVALAVVLPYVAVLVANAGRESTRPTTTQVTPPPRPALTAAAPSRPTTDEPLVGHITEPGDVPPSAAAPRTWDTERLRPPAQDAPAGTRSGDHRSAA